MAQSCLKSQLSTKRSNNVWIVTKKFKEQILIRVMASQTRRSYSMKIVYVLKITALSKPNHSPFRLRSLQNHRRKIFWILILRIRWIWSLQAQQSLTIRCIVSIIHNSSKHPKVSHLQIISRESAFVQRRILCQKHLNKTVNWAQMSLLKVLISLF